MGQDDTRSSPAKPLGSKPVLPLFFRPLTLYRILWKVRAFCYFSKLRYSRPWTGRAEPAQQDLNLNGTRSEHPNGQAPTGLMGFYSLHHQATHLNLRLTASYNHTPPRPTYQPRTPTDGKNIPELNPPALISKA